MAAVETDTNDNEQAVSRPPRRFVAFYLLLGFSAGLPFAMFNAVLSLRLAQHGVTIAVIGFFAWIALLPSFKFLWAPLLERVSVPGFGRYWGRRRGWIMLAQLGIISALAGLAVTDPDTNLAATALFAACLAFWTTTLEIAADGWRIEIAPTPELQAPIVAANLWGYRGAMVVAGSGAIWIAAKADWATAYWAMAIAALATALLLAAMRGEGEVRGRTAAIVTGLVASAAGIAVITALVAGVGSLALGVAAYAGLTSTVNVTPFVLGLCILPFAILALLLPRILTLDAEAPLLRSPAVGPYVDVFWRYGYPILGVLAFVSIYRMGDVLALALNHPMWIAKGYALETIAVADGVVSLLATIAGVAAGGWAIARWPLAWVLSVGALASAVGNLSYVWLWEVPEVEHTLYLAVAIDQAGNGMAAAVFVVYLSLLVNPRFPAAQYAFLSGFAFLLARLLAGASGSIHTSVGYDGFFLLSAGLSLAAILFLPFVAQVKPRTPDAGADGVNGSPQTPSAPGP